MHEDVRGRVGPLACPHLFKNRALGFALLACLALISCARTSSAPSTPPRYAILRFENLSGDPALDWTGRALSESLPASLSNALDGPVLAPYALSRSISGLGARPPAAPGVSTERAEALAAGANRIITGYVQRVGTQIRITASEEDITTGKTLLTLSASANSPFDAIAQLTREFSPRATPPITQNPEALSAYAAGLEAATSTAPALLSRAASLDPACGPCALALIGADLSRNDRAAAAADIESAQHRKLDTLSQARLNLEAARLNNSRSATIAAMRQLASLTPADTILFRNLADTETTAGDFTAAAKDWKQIAAASPDDALAWNSLGYARSFAGDYAGALAALQQYDRLRPKDANPQDSIGDLNYSFRRFKEAAANYLEAWKRQPDFQQGGDLYKAAWAKFEAGDKPAADSTFAQFRSARAKSAREVTDLIAGDWFFRTGRAGDAFSIARKVVSETQSEALRTDFNAQLAIWDLLANDRVQAAKDAAAIGPQITSSPVFIARFASLPSAPSAEWQTRAARMLAPNLTALRDLSLGYALLLDGKRADALPVWERIVTNAGATDFFARAVVARLRGEALSRPLLPDPNKLNQFAGILDKL
jgi:tetratricopeptide (TPR) repeat protein